jgi:hypothetical protein
MLGAVDAEEAQGGELGLDTVEPGGVAGYVGQYEDRGPGLQTGTSVVGDVEYLGSDYRRRGRPPLVGGC